MMARRVVIHREMGLRVALVAHQVVALALRLVHQVAAHLQARLAVHPVVPLVILLEDRHHQAVVLQVVHLKLQVLQHQPKITA